MALLKILLETKLVKHFHGESKMVFSKTQFCFFLKLYHVKWIFGYSRAKDAYHLLFKSYHVSKSKHSPTKSRLKLEISRILIVKNCQKSHVFRHTGIIITRTCRNVNSNSNFGIYIQYLQQPWTFLYVHLQFQIMTLSFLGNNLRCKALRYDDC